MPCCSPTKARSQQDIDIEMLQPKKKQKAIEAPGTQVAETKEQPANSAVPARSGTQVAPPAAFPAIEDRKPAYSAVKTCGGEGSLPTLESPRLVRALSERPTTRHVQPRLSWGCSNALQDERHPSRALSPRTSYVQTLNPELFCCTPPGPPGKLHFFL